MYRYDLKQETKYKVSASYTGYLTKFLEVGTVGMEDSKDFVGDFDFPLKSTAKPIELPEIFYDLNKASLRAESKKELDGLIKVLEENRLSPFVSKHIPIPGQATSTTWICRTDVPSQLLITS